MAVAPTSILIAIIFTVDFFIQVSMFLISYALQTDLFVDFCYGSTISIAAIISLIMGSELYKSQVFATIVVALHGFRLAFFLMKRTNEKNGVDSRFDKVRNNFLKYGMFWIFQGTAILILIIPIVILNTSTQDVIDYPSLLKVLDVNMVQFISFTIMLMGTLIEAIADEQKFSFKRIHPNDFIQHGLYRYCQHPNYLGEIMFWLGLFTYCSMSYTSIWYHWIPALLSPLTIIMLLLFVSGIPTLKQGRRYSERVDYQKYISETPLLIPFTNFLTRKKPAERKDL